MHHKERTTRDAARRRDPLVRRAPQIDPPVRLAAARRGRRNLVGRPPRRRQPAHDRAAPTPLGQVSRRPRRPTGRVGVRDHRQDPHPGRRARVTARRDRRAISPGVLRPSTGYALPVTDDGAATASGCGSARHGQGARRRGLPPGSPRAAPLTITSRTAAGLFHGVQTLRQQLPAAAEKKTKQTGPWRVAGGTIKDTPRYAYRGAMLDVSRHFFSVDKVKRYIDQMSLYKVNKLHLHLSDDQGWRIAIDSWPRLADVRRLHAGRRRPGRLLHEGPVQGDHRVRLLAAAGGDPRDRHAGPHERRARLVRRAELQRRGAPALHRHRGRLQLAVRQEGRDVRLRGRRDPRARRA